MRNLMLCLISALLLSCAWPTYGIPFLLFFALVPLLMAEHSIALFSDIKYKGWIVFGLSYLTFLIWNIATTGWLYGSLNPDGSHALPAVIIPVLANSLLYSTVFICYHFYKRKEGTYWGLGFLICIWMAFEKFHLGWELTWPWLNLGNGFSDYPKIIQWYDTVGATGGTLWILISNIFIFYTIRTWEAGRIVKDLYKNSSIVLGILFLPIAISLYKYHTFNEKPTGEITTLLLQPNLDPYTEKYEKTEASISSELINLAKNNTSSQIDFYIAPETAIPGKTSIDEYNIEQHHLINTIKNFLTTQPNSVFISGASTHRFIRDEENLTKNSYKVQPNVWVENYNTALQIDAQNTTKIYHKGKLVPGVEIFPYMNTLRPVLGDAMLNFGGSVRSLGIDEERSVFSNPYNNGIAAPIICYESIYGEFVTEYVKKGANFLAIVTNDSWWGVSEGHRQLLSYARLRAIENRREIARSANSGISAHIDARGEIVADTFYGDETALLANVKLYETQTTYTRIGDFVSRICLLILGFLILYPFAKWFRDWAYKQ